MPVKVAVLGGGPAGLAACWRLANDPVNDFEVTLYQEDHLLGGKCAAVRKRIPGDSESSRIEEHGIHILFGFYSQLFHMLKQAYDETAGLPSPTGTIRPFADAVTPNDHAFFAEEYPSGTWREPWRVSFPKRDGDPWDSPTPPDASATFPALAERFVGFLGDLSSGTGGGGLGPILLSVLESLLDFVQANPPLAAGMKGLLIEVIEKVIRSAWILVRPVLDLDPLRRLWMGTYLAGCNLLGLIKSDIFFGLASFESLDDVDYRAWLASIDPFAPDEVPPTLGWNSPPVRALYDVVFARSKTFAAGTMLQNALILALGYRGHLSYRMNGSMGEVVLSPLYRALQDKVSFKFFHRVTHLAVDDIPSGSVVGRIHVTSTINTATDYEPLIAEAVDDGPAVPSWPKVPNSFEAQPEDLVIARGADFDHVVLAIPVPEFDATGPSDLAAELIANSPAFEQMVLASTSSMTQTAQLWFDPELVDLGWSHALPSGQLPMLIGYARTANSWADMSHLCGFETHSGPGPKTIAYLADELLYGEGSSDADVEANIKTWLDAHAGRIWPDFDYDTLHDPSTATGAARLAAQFYRANAEGWHRYVLSEAVRIRHRLAPGESGFANLFLAGDWVKSTLNCGCVEAAVSTGVAAAEEIGSIA